MALLSFKASDFRCLADIELEASPTYNLIHGANASGKTSLLEAIAYLGRGKALRGATTQNLVRHGQAEFTLFGRVRGEAHTAALGVRNGRGGLEIHIDGTAGRGAADLAEILPLQAVDPEIHNLVAGGPEERRRYLDWSVFHVEHGYVQHWRRYRRALRQRNAALKTGGGPRTIRAWDRELLEAAAEVTVARERTTAVLQAALEPVAAQMLGGGVGLEYQPGWPRGKSLDEALVASLERDRGLGTTHAGPHRADLRLAFNERQARRLVSRGQQKLLACTLVFASVELVQAQIERPVLLLLDDPAAELDSNALRRLLDTVGGLGCQVVATALDPALIRLPEEPALFHVKHGQLHRES